MHITEGKSFPRYVNFFSGVLPIPPVKKKLTPKNSSEYVEISFENNSFEKTKIPKRN